MACSDSGGARPRLLDTWRIRDSVADFVPAMHSSSAGGRRLHCGTGLALHCALTEGSIALARLERVDDGDPARFLSRGQKFVRTRRRVRRLVRVGILFPVRRAVDHVRDHRASAAFPGDARGRARRAALRSARLSVAGRLRGARRWILLTGRLCSACARATSRSIGPHRVIARSLFQPASTTLHGRRPDPMRSSIAERSASAECHPRRGSQKAPFAQRPELWQRPDRRS